MSVQVEELRQNLVRETFVQDVANVMRMRGLNPSGFWAEPLYVRGREVHPHPEPGFLWIDSEPLYSAAWLP